MTVAVFETATLADSVKKAARVAPAKGQAFDKANGLILDVSADTTVIRATNLEVFYMEWVDSVSVDGDRAVWRLPAQLFASVLASLPIGSGKQVTLEQKENILHVTQGRTKARFNLLDPQYYPMWTAFDPDGLIDAPDLGGRLAQVEWAASSNSAEVPMYGVHFNGEIAVATDRYRLAVMPLVIPALYKPITVPARILPTVLPKSGEISIGLEGDQLLIMPDSTTQLRVICYAQDYPNVSKIMKRDQPDFVTTKKSALLEIMGRALNFAGSDRVPTMRLFFGKEEIAVMMANTEVGLLGDVVEVPGFCTHDRIEIHMTPKNIMDALTNCPNDELRIGYSSTNDRSVLYIDGGSGYEAWVAPRGKAEPPRG